MQLLKQSTQFGPSQYISKKHYKYQKGGAQKKTAGALKRQKMRAPQYKVDVKTWRLLGGGDEEVIVKILWLYVAKMAKEVVIINKAFWLGETMRSRKGKCTFTSEGFKGKM